jgi:hypothetical protein
MMTDAMIEWQNDWATYLPAKEPKKADMLIMHDSLVIDFTDEYDPVRPQSALLYRNQRTVAIHVFSRECT